MDTLKSKLIQLAAGALGGLLIAASAAVAFIVPCFIVTALDVYSAFCLGRRLHKKYPQKCDGKFKSEYKWRIFRTIGVGLAIVILAKYADMLILRDEDLAVRFAAGFFFVYQGWSILENWSSENKSPWARIIQRIVVNKAERHFNIEIKDLLIPEDTDDNKKE